MTGERGSGGPDGYEDGVAVKDVYLLGVVYA